MVLSGSLWTKYLLSDSCKVQFDDDIEFLKPVLHVFQKSLSCAAYMVFNVSTVSFMKILFLNSDSLNHSEVEGTKVFKTNFR